MKKYEVNQQENKKNQKITHGEPPADELINGPQFNRGCTDCLCLIIYILCTGYMCWIISYGFTNGHPERLTYAYDSAGNACGQSLEAISYPYIYLVSPYIDFFNRSVCVSTCPNWQSQYINANSSINSSSQSNSTNINNNTSSNITSANNDNTNNNTNNTNNNLNNNTNNNTNNSQVAAQNNTTNSNQSTTRIDRARPLMLSCIPNVNISVPYCLSAISFGPRITQDESLSNNTNTYDYLVQLGIFDILKNGLQQTSNYYSISHLMNYSTFIYNSTPFMNRICMPSGGGQEVQALINNISGAINLNYVDFYVQDVITVRYVIMASAGISLFIGLIYMLMMRYFAGILTWIAILFYFASLALLIVYTNDQSTLYQSYATQDSVNGVSDADNQKKSDGLKYLSYFLIALSGVSLIAFFILFNKIRLAIAIIKSASVYMIEEPFSLLIPPIFAIISILYWAFWIVSFAYIYSVGNIRGSSSSPFATIEWNQNTRYMIWYYLFMGLWNNAIIQSLCSFILASACCIWYFSQGPGQKFFQFPILISVKRGLLNHLGSLALGSFILALVQFIRIWLEYINYQVNQIQGDKPQPLKCIIDTLRCCALCFQRFVEFLNKNAFIQIALTGKSFFPAAKDGFYLISTNLQKFSVTNGIGGIFIGVGKLFIAFVTSYLCYLLITKDEQYSNISSPLLPVFFFFVISYVVGSLFMSVYGMAIDSILQCSIIDEEINKKIGHPPQYCPQPLKDFYQSQK